jgi:hypothetical protein
MEFEGLPSGFEREKGRQTGFGASHLSNDAQR